jgi:hypothetical protein
MASIDIVSSASMFTSLLAGDCLTTNSVSLCNDLQQWGLLCLHQGQLSHNRLGLVCLPADSIDCSLDSRLGGFKGKTANDQSARLSLCQAVIWGPRPDFYYCQTVAGLLMWGVLYDEKAGLSFIIAAGPCQRNHTYRL